MKDNIKIIHSFSHACTFDLLNKNENHYYRVVHDTGLSSSVSFILSKSFFKIRLD